MRVVLITILLSASSALAQASSGFNPEGHFFFGMGLGLVQPFARSLVTRQPMSTGIGFSFNAHYESRAFLVGAELAHGSFGGDDSYSNPVALSLRAGPLLGRGRFAPYIAAGVSLLAYGLVGDDAASATGASVELGVLMFRERRWGRVTPYLEVFLPLSSGDTGAVAGTTRGSEGPNPVISLRWATAGVRFEL